MLPVILQPPPPGVRAGAANQRLFVGRGLNLQSTTDQPLNKVFDGTRFIVSQILACGRGGGASVACLGGIYTGPGKTGSVLVASGQSWLGVSAAGKLVQPTPAALLSPDEQSAGLLYFSLTTGSIAAATADLFVFGVITD
jgi:hypothetical protein